MSGFDKDAVSLKILTDWNSREYNCEGQKQASLQVLINTALEERQNRITKLEKVVEAAKLLDKLKLIKDARGKTDYYKESKPKAWLNLSEALSELTRTPAIKNED